jgi:cytochrome P460
MEGRRNIQFALWLMLGVMIFIGCASYRSGAGKKETTDGKLPPPEASSFWEFITRSNPYRNWAFYPPKQGLYPSMRRGLTPARNPHGAYLKLYGNTAAIQTAGEAHDKPMPDGAMLIMEDYDKDKVTLKSVTVMYRVKGYNPAEGDWFWGRYGPDGQVLESGKVERCIECHRTQDWHDWRFTGAMPHH